MEDLYSIKRKLETYKKMKQMAEAMKLAAITGYSSLAKKILLAKNYLTKVNATVASFLCNVEAICQNDECTDSSLYLPDFFQENNALRSLVIVVGATKELGTGHTSMLKSFLPKIIMPSATAPVDFFFLGKSPRKAFSSLVFEQDSYRVVGEIRDFSFNTLASTVDEITKFISSSNMDYKKCMIVNMRFKGLFSHQRNAKIILPIIKNQEIKELVEVYKAQPRIHDYLLEQAPDQIGILLRDKVVATSIWYEIIESLCAENASRYVSMDKAVTNAEKCIGEISLKMNKVRQIMITKQITEISCYTDL